MNILTCNYLVDEDQSGSWSADLVLHCLKFWKGCIQSGLIRVNRAFLDQRAQSVTEQSSTVIYLKPFIAQLERVSTDETFHPLWYQIRVLSQWPGSSVKEFSLDFKQSGFMKSPNQLWYHSSDGPAYIFRGYIVSKHHCISAFKIILILSTSAGAE